jgi:hypothetical protein
MPLLEDLVSVLTGGGVGLTLTTGTTGNLCLGLLPDSPVNCGSLVEYEGNTLLRSQDDAGTLTERPRVQFMWRDSDYTTGLAQIRDAWALMDITNATINATFYQRVEPVQAPFVLGRDDNDRWLFAFNLVVTREAP